LDAESRSFIFGVFKRFIQNPLGMVATFAKSIRFILRELAGAPRFKTRNELLEYSLGHVAAEGLFLEFGVYKGDSINHIARLKPKRTIYGFDSFGGLPEDWGIRPKGYFKTEIPKVLGNVRLVVGLFQDTLERFLEEHPEKVAFVHMDADVYSATRYVLFALAKNSRLQTGTVVQFDELFNYSGWWMDGEYKALLEFAGEFGVSFRYLGYRLENGVGAGAVSTKILRVSRCCAR
jgi:hypothetical protein